MNLRRTQFSGIIAIGTVLVLAGCGASSLASRGTNSTVTKTVAAAPSSASPTVSKTPQSTAPTSPPAPVTSQSSAPSPSSVVDAYFAAINAKDYEEAWSLGGDNLGQSYTQFVDGFSSTVTDNVDVLSTSGDAVSVNLTATQTDGSQQQFTGTYTVSGQAISGASVTQIGAPAPSSASSLCGAPANPYGYNLCGVGSKVTAPQSDICDYFQCIDNFGNGNGYMVECNDGKYSMSGGIDGVCSDHDGEGPAVYDGS